MTEAEFREILAKQVEKEVTRQLGELLAQKRQENGAILSQLAELKRELASIR
jgi:hypothetical protein